MIDNIEFYNSPDGSICVKPEGEPMFVLEESNRKLIQEILATIRELYPDAFKALSELYTRSESNRSFFEFRIVSRFIRCNFGEYDALSKDIDAMGAFHLEDVRCPLRGECLMEGRICRPTLQTALSPREAEVARLYSAGYDRLAIANELNISVYTVVRHISNIKARLKLRHSNQIISLFKG